MSNYVLLMMGGCGSRFGGDLPKQFIDIDGRPLFTYIVRKLSKLDAISGIVIVVNSNYLDQTNKWVDEYCPAKILKVVGGGASRSESVFNGLKALEGLAAPNDVVLMHDATHPYVDEEGTRKVIKMVQKFGSSTLVSCNYDTTYQIDDNNNIVDVIPRKYNVAGASPEGFRYQQIYDIYEKTPENEMEKMTSVGAIALAHHIPMKVVPTSVLNLKITYPEDMKLFMQLYKTYFFNE